MFRYSKEGRAGWDPTVGQVSSNWSSYGFKFEFDVISKYSGKQRGEETKCVDRQPSKDSAREH